MKLAYRGVVDEDGDVVGWPTLLMDHNTAFAVLPQLMTCRARWRQWQVGERIDIDPGGEQHREQIEAWLRAVQET